MCHTVISDPDMLYFSKFGIHMFHLYYLKVDILGIPKLVLFFFWDEYWRSYTAAKVTLHAHLHKIREFQKNANFKIILPKT